MLKSVVKTQNIEKEKEVMILMFLSYFVPMTQSYAGIISILSVQIHLAPRTADESEFPRNWKTWKRNYLFGRCNGDNCNYSHRKDAPLTRVRLPWKHHNFFKNISFINLFQLVNSILDARKSIDLALFEITSEELSGEWIHEHLILITRTSHPYDNYHGQMMSLWI